MKAFRFFVTAVLLSISLSACLFVPDGTRDYMYLAEETMPKVGTSILQDKDC